MTPRRNVHSCGYFGAPPNGPTRTAEAFHPAYGYPMPAVLIAMGAILIVLTFLLAFTIFGVISALLGVACIVMGTMMLGRTAHGPGTD